MKTKRLASAVLSICLFVSMSMNTFAVEIKMAEPLSGNVDAETEYAPLGQLTEDERESLLNKDPETSPQLHHFHLTPHLHEITSITNEYSGQRNRGVVAQTVSRVNTSAVLTYERSRGISNNFSVNIGFSDDIISGELGYDVTFEDSATASYAVNVDPNMMASITLYDMYDVTEFNVKTTYSHGALPAVYFTYDYGTGWAEQWTHFGFSSRVW